MSAYILRVIENYYFYFFIIIVLHSCKNNIVKLYLQLFIDQWSPVLPLYVIPNTPNN